MQTSDADQPAHDGDPAVRADIRDRQLTGAAAMALGVSMLAQNIVALVTDPPTYGAPIDKVLTHHAAISTAVGIAVGLEALNLPLLLGFLAGLHGLLGRRGGPATTWSRLALAAGSTLSAIWALYAVLWVGVVLAAGRQTEPTPAFTIAWQLHAAAFALALPALGTTFVATALAARVARITPASQCWLGVVGGSLAIVAGTACLGIANGSPWLFVGLPGYFGWILWLLATGFHLLRTGSRGRPTANAGQSAESIEGPQHG